MKNKTEKNIIPNSVKIGYVNYEFDFWPDTFASTEEAQGEFFQSQGKIGLKSSSLDSIHGVNTVLHEIMHGIVYQYGLVEHLGDKEEVTEDTAELEQAQTVLASQQMPEEVQSMIEKVSKRISDKGIYF